MRILTFSDDGVATGYGRYAMEMNTRLHQTGHTVMSASMMHTGLLPAMYEGQPLPYWVAPLGQTDWLANFQLVMNQFQPDVVCIIKDLSYIELLSSVLQGKSIRRVAVTGIDGKPIAPRWLNALQVMDAVVSFSQFGVDALAEHGIPAVQIAPAVDHDRFYPLEIGQRLELRKRLDIAPETFVLATMAHNQSRKAIPHMLEGFFHFHAHHPDSIYLMDMLPEALGGWDIPALCVTRGWDVSLLRFHADVMRLSLMERYNLADAHAVLAYREGWGLPLVEAMACGVVSMALDWCSGTEICGDGKGVLVKSLDYQTVSNWGNALDYHPDVHDFAEKLAWLADHPDERHRIAERGQAWAQSFKWDSAFARFHALLEDLSL